MLYLKSPTTDGETDQHQTFKVTHPFHPLYGKEYSLITIRHLWGAYRVYYHDNEEQLRSMPINWTNIPKTDPYVHISNGRVPFRITDLLELRALIDRLNAHYIDN